MKNLLKEIQKKKRAFRAKIKDKINKFLIKFCSRNEFLAALYYSLYSKDLRCSAFKILNSVREFKNRSDQSWVNISIMMRNAHRIEKALCIHGSSRLFALDFIGETMEAFANEVNADLHKDRELIRWANDILTLYFDKFKDEEKVKTHRLNFLSLQKKIEAIANEKNKLIPYEAAHIKLSNISLDEFETLSKQRKSVRFFDENKKVEKEKLVRAVEVALNSPTACNKSPLKFYFVESEEKLKIAKTIPSGITCFSDYIPIICFLVTDLSAYHSEGGMLGTPYVDAGLVGTNFMYALELQGLSSCPLNWTHKEKKERDLKKLLGLKDYEHCTVCFAIGYKMEGAKICYSQRKSASNAISFK